MTFSGVDPRTRTRRLPTPRSISSAIAIGIFMVISITGVNVGVPAASGAPTCQSLVETDTAKASDLTGACDEASIEARAKTRLDEPSTTSTALGWAMFSVLTLLILLSLATGREIPEPVGVQSEERHAPRRRS